MALFSIITINYNNSEGLKKTIHSVSSQTYKNIEYIIIDGGSNDGSKEVIADNSKAVTSWVSEKDKGIYDAMNKGINRATGKYCLFLNSGDILGDNSVLEKVAVKMVNERSFYYGNLIRKNGSVMEKHMAPKTIDLDLMLNSTLWHPCVFIKSELFKLYGLYNTDFKITGDYEFFIRCLIKPNVSTEYLNEFISVFEGDGISNSSEQIVVQEQEREMAWKLNVSDAVYAGLKKQNAFSRSKYSSLINTLQKLRGKKDF